MGSHSKQRILGVVALTLGCLVGGVSPTVPAAAAPPPPIPVLPPVDPGPNGTVPIARADVDPALPVSPQPLAVPTRPGQELVDEVQADALAALGAAGLLDPGGEPAIGVDVLQPQAGSPGGGLLGLLGLPRFQICYRSATLPVTCSGPGLLGSGNAIDVTGDGTRDLLVRVAQAFTGTHVRMTRLISSETRGGPLVAQVWVVEDAAHGTARRSMGFDGLRRGTSLPLHVHGLFQYAESVGGQLDSTVTVDDLKEPGAALAVTTGLSALSGTGTPTNPTVASVRFSPGPLAFTTSAAADLDAQTAAAASSAPSETLIVTEAAADRFVRIAFHGPGSSSVDLARTPGTGAAGVAFSGAGGFRATDLVYEGAELARSFEAAADDPAATLDASVSTTTDAITVDYQASGPSAALDTTAFDRAAGVLVALGLTGPANHLNLVADAGADSVEVNGDALSDLIRLEVTRNGGAVPELGGDHLAMVTQGPAIGVAVLLTGRRSVRADFGPHPGLRAEGGSAGPALLAAASINGHRHAELGVSQVPGSVQLALDPVAGTVVHAAGAVVPEVVAASVDTVAGPTVRAVITDAPTSLDVTYGVGLTPGLEVAADGATGWLRLFASAAPLTSVDPDTDQYLSVAAADLPTALDVGADFALGRLAGTASGPLGGIEAVTRADVFGDSQLLALALSGVPGGFMGDFGRETVGIRSLSGVIDTARLLATNKALPVSLPTMDHVAVHFRELLDEFDASVLAHDVRSVGYVHTTSRQTFTLDVDEGPPMALDIDLLSAELGVDDTRRFVAAEVASLPATLLVETFEGQLAFRTDQPVILRAEARFGKVAALSGLGVPLFSRGLAVAAAGCTSGPGCATDPDPVCTTFPGRCYGVIGIASMPLLRSEASADLENRTLSIHGDLQVPGAQVKAYLRIDDLVGTVARLSALAVLDGLPDTVDLELGPIGFVPGSVTELEVGFTNATGAIGGIRVDADLDSTTAFGDLRGRLAQQPVPASTLVSGEFGSVSEIHVDTSAPTDILSMQVTGLLLGNPASGLAALTNIPAHVDLLVTGYDDQAGLGVPELDYSGRGVAANPSSTLDGLVQVEEDLVEAFALGGVTIPSSDDVWLRLTDLGADTVINTQPSGAVQLLSSPSTGELAIGSNLEQSVANIPINTQVFDQAGFTGTLVGHVGAPTIHLGEMELNVNGLRSLALTPGNVDFLTIGVQGNYDLLAVDVDDVFIDPDVDLTLEVDGPLAMDFAIPMVIDDPMTNLRFHLSDQVLREASCISQEVFGVGEGHVRIFTKPGRISTGVGSINVFGADGPQALNYLDPVPTPIGLDPELAALANALITVYVTDPFGDADAQFDADFGEC